MRGTPLKARLAKGEVVCGTMVFEFDSPGFAKIVAAAGAEFIILDMERSGWDFPTIKRQGQWALGVGLVPAPLTRAISGCRKPLAKPEFSE